jgi:hypothetical protein
VITGYNTDVEHDGVVYHVQTEDKGVQLPEIISHVFVRGEILATKRTSYQDLIARDFDEDLLRKRLERQHKLICAAVHAGRIEDLKQMSEREASLHLSASPDAPPLPIEAAAVESISESTDADDGLAIRLMDDKELRGGESVTLRLRVRRSGRVAVKGATVTVKTLGTNFSPQTTRSVTDERGVVTFSMTLPDFKAGRAAILIQCEDCGEIAELRRIILPAAS